MRKHSRTRRKTLLQKDSPKDSSRNSKKKRKKKKKLPKLPN
jgi:hypothetical protein